MSTGLASKEGGVDAVVDVDDQSSAGMRELFARVFGHEMSAEHWDWKYRRGGGHAVGLMREGRMVAHYGGVPRRISWLGQPAMACQVCDVMVEKSANAALVRRGPLYQVAAAFLEAQVGDGRPHRVAFGFPSARHHALAVRLGLYGTVDRLVKVSWPAAEAARSDVEVRPIDRPGQGFEATQARTIDGLCRRMIEALPEAIVGVRDAQWLEYRYLARPGVHYELMMLHRGWLRRAFGVMVLRRHEAHLELLDMVARPEDFGAIVGAARDQARLLGLARVDAWITASQLHRLPVAGDAQARVTDLQIPLPHIAHTPGPSAAEQRDRWLLMAGDADFT